MKQVRLNILVSVILLGIVFFVANLGVPYTSVNASTTTVSGIMVDSVDEGHVHLHGFGFRPGSLVNLELKPRDGGDVISGASTWVDTQGSFSADFDLTGMTQEAASLGQESTPRWNDWVVVASASTGSFTVPVAAQNSSQQ